MGYTTQEVTIRWNDDPTEIYNVNVIVGDGQTPAWETVDNDDEIFFYFASEAELNSARSVDSGFDFTILDDAQNN